MREGYEPKRLGELYKISSGKSINASEISENITDESQIPCYGGNGIRGYVVDESHNGTYPIVGRVGAQCGNVHLATGKFYATEHALVFSPKSSDINHNWVVYALQYRNLGQYAKGVAQPVLSAGELSNIEILYPSHDIQKSIVSELDLINELISKKKAQLADLDSLAQSLFNEMFGDPVENPMGWKCNTLGSISEKINSGNTPSGGSNVYVNNGILFLRSQNVWRNRIDLEDVAYIDEETNSKMKRSVLHKNDILITKTGRVNTENSSLGRAALFEGEDGSANVNGHVYLVRLKEGYNHKFILRILISKSFRDLIRRVCVGGIDKRQLNRDHIEGFPIIMPPSDLIEKYIKSIEAIESSKSSISDSLASLETLLASRMQYYFD